MKKCRAGGLGEERSDDIDNQKLKATEWEDRKRKMTGTGVGEGGGGAAKRKKIMEKEGMRPRWWW